MTAPQRVPVRSLALSALAAVSTGLAALAALASPPPVSAQVKEVTELRYPPLAPLVIPEPERVELDNGLVLLLMEDHELPIVEATAFIRTGTQLDPADKVGLGRLAGSVLRSGGSTKLGGDALDEALEDRAALIEVGVGNSVASAFLSSLAKDFPDVLGLFADLLRHPTFDEEKLKVAKPRALSYLARQNDDPNGIAFRELRKLVYGPDSPYSRTETFQSILAIEREDLVAWHGRYFHPNRMLLGITGDFKKEEVVKLVRQTFGDWPRGPELPAVDIPYRKTPSPGVFFAEKNDVTQVAVLMGHLGLRRDHPDYFALEVANEVLSGSFAARLMSNIRSRKGLAYSVFGGVQSDWDHPGLAFLSMGTKTATAGAGIDALLGEARGMTERPPTDAEIALAKEAILNAFVFRVDSKGEILSQRLQAEYYGYPADLVHRYRAGIEAVTAEEVRAAAARHLRPAEMSILVVGPGQGMDRPLSDFGKVTHLDLAIPDAPGKQGASR